MPSNRGWFMMAGVYMRIPRESNFEGGSKGDLLPRTRQISLSKRRNGTCVAEPSPEGSFSRSGGVENFSLFTATASALSDELEEADAEGTVSWLPSTSGGGTRIDPDKTGELAESKGSVNGIAGVGRITSFFIE